MDGLKLVENSNASRSQSAIESKSRIEGYTSGSPARGQQIALFRQRSQYRLRPVSIYESARYFQ